jgi:membrane-associated protease RseP (regulator of RpoE activity)
MGHYIAARIHGVNTSPPLFIPLPLLLGTMGAVIQMRERIERRNALLDIGAAGPLAGMVIALPVLIYGLSISPVEELAQHASEETFVEGRGLLYWGLLYALKGPIPEGHDIWLGPTAMAGWAGLLVTMINLVPIGQLDGGHVAYALFGERQNRFSTLLHRALPFIGITVSMAYLVPAYLRGERGEALYGDAMAGMHWITWAIVLSVLFRFGGHGHPPTGDERLSPMRRAIAVGTLVLFVLLFMPSWIYVPDA